MKKILNDSQGYAWKISGHTNAHTFLLPKLNMILSALEKSIFEKRYFDLGFGNGSVANWMFVRGWVPTGIDLSTDGVLLAQKNYPHLNLHKGSVYDDLASQFGKFPLVLSLEVVEHLYDPKLFIKRAYDLLDEGGVLIMSTPYHGYMKNLVMAIFGLLDKHFTVLWDHGHIKFWSKKTLSKLVYSAGFEECNFFMAGRFYPISKSMILIAKKKSS